MIDCWYPQVSDAGNQEITVEVTEIDRRKSDEHTIEMTPNAVYGINRQS